MRIGDNRMNIIDEINEIIASFKELSGVGVCFYDLENFFDYDKVGNRENAGHYCELCKCVKLLEGGRSACDVSDRREAIELAHQYDMPFFFRCHIGLCELVVPIRTKGELSGVIFLGQCRISGEDDAETVSKNAAKRGGDEAGFRKMYEALPVLSRTSLISMGKILQLYFKGLSEKNEFFRGHGQESRGQICQRIAAYIGQHYAKDINSRQISKVFFINQSYLARKFKKEYGCTITDYICKVRIENAKKLIQNTSLPIHSIALNVGFSDANYFSRVFLEKEGVTPGSLRAKGL